MTATMMGIPIYDTSYTNIQTDSLEPYKLKFNSDGSADSYLANGSLEETISWSQIGDQITITDSDTSFTLTVLSLDANNSTLSMSLSETDVEGSFLKYSRVSAVNGPEIVSGNNATSTKKSPKAKWFWPSPFLLNS